MKNLNLFLFTFLLIFTFKSYAQNSHFAIKTNLAYVFKGIPVTLELALGKKSSIVSDLVITPIKDYRIGILRGSINNRFTVGFRKYFLMKVPKPMEGLYLQPTLFYSRNKKTATNAFSLGASAGFQIKIKEVLLIDIGSGFGILNDKISKEEGFFDESYGMIHPKIGFGIVIK